MTFNKTDYTKKKTSTVNDIFSLQWLPLNKSAANLNYYVLSVYSAVLMTAKKMSDNECKLLEFI